MSPWETTDYLCSLQEKPSKDNSSWFLSVSSSDVPSGAPVAVLDILLSCNIVNYLLMTYIAHRNKPQRISQRLHAQSLINNTHIVSFCCHRSPWKSWIFYNFNAFLDSLCLSHASSSAQTAENRVVTWRLVTFHSSAIWCATAWHAVLFPSKTLASQVRLTDFAETKHCSRGDELSFRAG